MRIGTMTSSAAEVRGSARWTPPAATAWRQSSPSIRALRGLVAPELREELETVQLPFTPRTQSRRIAELDREAQLSAGSRACSTDIQTALFAQQDWLAPEARARAGGNEARGRRAGGGGTGGPSIPVGIVPSPHTSRRPKRVGGVSIFDAKKR